MFPKSRLFHLLRLLLLAVSLWPVWGVAQDAAPGNGQLLQASQAFALSARIASPGVLRLHWDIAPHYYLYRGRIQVQSKDAAMHLGELDLPDGLKEHDPYLGNVEIYHGSLDARVPYSGTAANLRIAVTFQGCHEVDPKICYPPITQVLSVPLTGSQAGAIILPESDISQRGGARGFQPQMAAQSSLSSSGAESPHSTVVSPLRSALSDLPLALVLAFAGGLILNLMPCVLPVLAIKAIGLLESAESQARTRTHALAYTAGVLASFITLGLCILAMRSAGHALGWGTQLQQPLVVAVLACVLFVLGLNFSGIVRMGLGIGSAGSALMMRPGLAGDFFTGVLAVVIASPCTAPFMGTALAYAFVAPGVAALLVFLMLGLGLALPFLLIGFVPRLARWLPRPGRWMETLKQLLAFPMYLSAVWLVWVVANQRGVDAAGLVLISMVLVAMALWWFERSRPGHGRMALRGLAIVPLLLAIAPIALIARLRPPDAPARSQTAAIPYDPARLAQLRARHVPVFVNMSADWCVTCKANEYAVLDTSAFGELLRRTGTVYMQGDWTHEDPAISAFLKEYDSPGVPLYVLFPRDGSPGRKLPTVLTAGFLQRSLTAAAQ